MYKKVFIDQCGYLPGAEKKLTIRCEQPMKFEVLRSDGAGVYGGIADVRIDNKAAGEIDGGFFSSDRSRSVLCAHRGQL